MTVPDTRELAERVRRGLGAGDRLVPGTMSEEEHLAGIALDALLAEVDQARRERDEAVTAWNCVAGDLEQGRDDEQREHIEQAESEVVRLTTFLREYVEETTFRSSLPSESPSPPSLAAWEKARSIVAAAGSPTDEETP